MSLCLSVFAHFNVDLSLFTKVANTFIPSKYILVTVFEVWKDWRVYCFPRLQCWDREENLGEYNCYLSRDLLCRWIPDKRKEWKERKRPGKKSFCKQAAFRIENCSAQIIAHLSQGVQQYTNRIIYLLNVNSELYQ